MSASLFTFPEDVNPSTNPSDWSGAVIFLVIAVLSVLFYWTLRKRYVPLSQRAEVSAGATGTGSLSPSSSSRRPSTSRGTTPSFTSSPSLVWSSRGPGRSGTRSPASPSTSSGRPAGLVVPPHPARRPRSAGSSSTRPFRIAGLPRSLRTSLSALSLEASLEVGTCFHQLSPTFGVMAGHPVVVSVLSSVLC
jgi:hypothetical protein